ncbi:hypothetical protein NDU88_003863 [Pleurodeles waltl]|uniref:Uncharacterized protein n=1 Tax=Pleurodeles waltl TaxID=8319 RepID=A0AAV7PB33_PLEWA|nr:hypothetical protein NDU88_003863 [Pleurodeles waltl]
MAPLGSVEVSVEGAGHRLPLHTAGLRVSGLSGGALGSPPRVSVRPGDDRASEGPTGGRVASPRSPGVPRGFLRRPSACLWVLRGLCLSRARPSAALSALSAPGVVPPADLCVPRGRPSACLRAPRGHPSAVSGLSPGPWGRPSALSRGPGRVTQLGRAPERTADFFLQSRVSNA